LEAFYLTLYCRWSATKATEAIGKMAKHADKLVWLDSPIPNGHSTVVDVAKAGSLEKQQRAVEEWARDVWQA